jgi:hypothetical protein
MVETNEELALRNFDWLKCNSYPGRGFVVGLDKAAENIIQLYWMMGRSPGSRNRLFKFDTQEGWLWTEVADQTKEKGDPALTLYNAMREYQDLFVVSNGSQTDQVVESLLNPLQLHTALRKYHYEDDPNSTQRITAVCLLNNIDPPIQISILRKSLLGAECDRLLFQYPSLHPGFGYCATTYAGDGNPLPPFRGDPLIMPLVGSATEIMHRYWEALNEENRVSIAVKSINRTDGTSHIECINKYKQVG